MEKLAEETDGDLAKFGKNLTQIMIFLPHFMWAENIISTQVACSMTNDDRKRCRFFCKHGVVSCNIL